nr:MAG TPA: hypothetical protein [Caudoviricetes sp.]
MLQNAVFSRLFLYFCCKNYGLTNIKNITK